MPIKYTIQENRLTTPSTFKGVVKQSTTFDMDDLVRQILDQGSTVTEADIKAVVIDLIKACQNSVLNGARVNIEGLVQIYPSMEGVFTGVTDGFDPLRHRLNLNARVADQFKDAIRTNAQIEKELTPSRVPTIYEVVDTFAGTTNSTISMGRMIQVVGEQLKFDSGNADEGLYVVNDTLGSTIQIPANLIFTSTEGEISFQAQVSGTIGQSMHVELRTRMGNSPTYPLKIASSMSLTLA